MQSYAACIAAPSIFQSTIPEYSENSSIVHEFLEIFCKPVGRTSLAPSIKLSDDNMCLVNSASGARTLISQFSTLKSRQLSKEEEFIERHKLGVVVKAAESCIKDLFGPDVKTSLEYCTDQYNSDFEWLDLNLHYPNVDELQIESLLEKVDELNVKFEKQVGIEAAMNVNFYLDVL